VSVHASLVHAVEAIHWGGVCVSVSVSGVGGLVGREGDGGEERGGERGRGDAYEVGRACVYL
jgi:hypothetical protein